MLWVPGEAPYKTCEVEGSSVSHVIVALDVVMPEEFTFDMLNVPLTVISTPAADAARGISRRTVHIKINAAILNVFIIINLIRMTIQPV
jgi:hypothetical protein